MKYFLQLIVTAIIFYISQLLFPEFFYFSDIRSILLITIIRFILRLVLGITIVIPIILFLSLLSIRLDSGIVIVAAIIVFLLIFTFLDMIILRYISNTYDFFSFYGNDVQLFLFTIILNILTYSKDEVKKKEDK